MSNRMVKGAQDWSQRYTYKCACISKCMYIQISKNGKHLSIKLFLKI